VKPLLSLVGIFRNESASIRKVLESAKPFIDSYTIIDTGSTDGTQDIIREVMAGVPGTLHEEPFISVTTTKGWEGFEGWIDFAATRNRVLDLDAASEFKTEFSLMLSGDESLREGEKLRTHLEAHRDSKVDCHFVRVNVDDTTLFSQRVLRTGSAWRYEEVVHELARNRVDAEAPFTGVPDVTIEHVVSDPEARLANVEERHIPLLKRLLEDEPENERALYFLAQSYGSLIPYMRPGEKITYAMEAMSLYLRRLMIQSGTDVERHCVQMYYLDLARLTNVYTNEELFSRVAGLSASDPTRPETALLLAEIAKKGPAQRVYDLAVRAADIAAQAKTAINNSSPVSTSCEWKAHHLAAIAARQLATRSPDKYGPLVKHHVDAGLAAGGAWMDFQAIMPPEEGTDSGVPMSSFSVP